MFRSPGQIIVYLLINTVGAKMNIELKVMKNNKTKLYDQLIFSSAFQYLLSLGSRKGYPKKNPR